MPQNEENLKIEFMFPTPVYRTHKDSGLDSLEKKEIEDIIKEKTCKVGDLDHYTDNKYIFNTKKLKKIKEFCEQHIKTYVKKILTPKEEFDPYITQSWLNVIEPGGNIQQHWHSNSIISGAFYVSTVEDDNICFYNPNYKIKEMISIEPKQYNSVNSDCFRMSVNTFDLLLFPSWLEHGVLENEKATTDRISLSFNVFATGSFGDKGRLNELIL